jgi:hypothetical protein
VGAELLEGGVEAIEVIGKKTPCNNHNKGQDDLSDYKCIQGLFVVPQSPRIDRNYHSINNKGTISKGRKDRGNKSITLELLKVIIQDTINSVNRVGSSSVSQDNRKVRVSRVKTGDGQRKESEEEDSKASPDHILGRHYRGGRLSIEDVGSLKTDLCL